MSARCQSIRPLANDFITLYQSPDPQRLFSYSPGIARLESGRLVASIDLGGPGAADLPEPKYQRGEMGWSWQGKVYTSDDGGASRSTSPSCTPVPLWPADRSTSWAMPET